MNHTAKEGVYLIFNGTCAFGHRDIAASLLCSAASLNFCFHRAHIDGSKVKAFEDTVDLTGVFSTDHNVRESILRIAVFKNAIQNTVFLCFLTEFLQFGILNSEDLQLFAASQHIGESRLAACLLLISEDCIK